MAEILDTLEDRTGERLVGSVVQYDFKNAVQNGHDRDELVGCGRLGLALAVNQYNECRGGFVNFAYNKIRQSIIEYLRQKRNRLVRAVEFNIECYREEAVGRDIENKDIAGFLLSCLHSHEKKVVVRLYYQGETVLEAAESLGVGRSSVLKYKKSAVEKMRRKAGF